LKFSAIYRVQADIHDHLSVRRSSYNVESLRGVPRHGNIGSSASKVDILRSALEINHKSSNNSMLSKADNKTSNQSLGRNRADSAPKLNHSNLKNISQPALEGVVLEVSAGPQFPKSFTLSLSPYLSFPSSLSLTLSLSLCVDDCRQLF